MPFIDTHAICLGRRTLSGADRLLTVLTPDQGRVMVVVPGLARANGPLHGALAPFAVWRVIMGSGRGLLRLESAEAICRLPHLHDRLGPMRAAGMVCGWVRATSRETPGDPQGRDRFALLTTALRALNRVDRDAAAVVVARFLWRWADLSGVGPDWQNCVACGTPAPHPEGGLRFSPGGRVCGSCRKAGDVPLSRRDGTNLDAGLSACNHPYGTDWRGITATEARGLASLAQRYLRYHFGQQLP